MGPGVREKCGKRHVKSLGIQKLCNIKDLEKELQVLSSYFLSFDVSTGHGKLEKSRPTSDMAN